MAGMAVSRKSAIVMSSLSLAAVWTLPYFQNVPTNLNLISSVLLILFVSCHRSLRLRDSSVTPPEDRETLSKEDALRFPFVGSAVLFGLFLILKIIPKDIINSILACYFSFIGAISLASLLEPVSLACGHYFCGLLTHQRTFGRAFSLPVVGSVSLIFTGLQLACMAVSFPVAFIYWKTKWWLLNNLFGLAFAVQGIESISIGSFNVSAILLCGLFFYDIFWVFGTDKILKGESVMVTVAKGIDAPIKLLFPRIANISAVAISNSTTVPIYNFSGERLEFSMLGLGDIVIPGFLLALLLRFDAQRANAEPAHGAYGVFPKPYFYSVLASYAAGLVTTIMVMEHFKAAQPALLYLVPACLGATLLTAVVRGEVGALLAYNEEPGVKGNAGDTAAYSSSDLECKKVK
jgi:minor histocompatibility antigen H13